jgi:hypothetical protein
MLFEAMAESQYRHQPGMTYAIRHPASMDKPNGGAASGGGGGGGGGGDRSELVLKLTEPSQCWEVGVAADFGVCGHVTVGGVGAGGKGAWGSGWVGEGRRERGPEARLGSEGGGRS